MVFQLYSPNAWEKYVCPSIVQQKEGDFLNKLLILRGWKKMGTAKFVFFPRIRYNRTYLGAAERAVNPRGRPGCEQEGME